MEGVFGFLLFFLKIQNLQDRCDHVLLSGFHCFDFAAQIIAQNSFQFCFFVSFGGGTWLKLIQSLKTVL